MVRYADQKHGQISIHKICNLSIKYNSSYIKMILIYTHSIRDFQDVQIHKKQLFDCCYKCDFLLLVTILSYCTIREKKNSL